MSDEYTPSWSGSADVADETPAGDRFGSGVGFHDGEGEPDSEQIRRPGADIDQNDPSYHGEPRHPTIHLTAGECGDWRDEITTLTAHRCGGGYTIVEHYDDLDPLLSEGAPVRMDIYGVREGDTNNTTFCVSSIDLTRGGQFRVSYRHDGELPVLDRWLDEGCILCQEGDR